MNFRIDSPHMTAASAPQDSSRVASIHQSSACMPFLIVRLHQKRKAVATMPITPHMMPVASCRAPLSVKVIFVDGKKQDAVSR